MAEKKCNHCDELFSYTPKDFFGKLEVLDGVAYRYVVCPKCGVHIHVGKFIGCVTVRR